MCPTKDHSPWSSYATVHPDRIKRGVLMNLNAHETGLVFSIMRDLSGDFDHVEVRQRVGQRLLELLKAEYFASYVWDEAESKFVS